MNCLKQNIVVEEANKLLAESLHDNFFNVDPTIEKIVVQNSRYQKRGVQVPLIPLLFYLFKSS